VSQLKAEFEPEDHDWIHTVRFQIAVPKIVRLLGFDRLPAHRRQAQSPEHLRS
jgi:hypothetical protein